MKRLFSLLALTLFAFLPISAFSESMQVTDAKLGKRVENRVISEEAASFALNEKVFLVLTLTGNTANSVNVNWKVGDSSDTMSLKVGGSPWHTWATKTARTAGDWTVTVTDASGRVLKEMTFTVQ
jgi:hypothetical protein